MTRDDSALGPLREHDERRVEFVQAARGTYPKMDLDSPSVVFLGNDAWIAIGVEGRTRYVVRADLPCPKPCVLRVSITRESTAWGEVFITGGERARSTYDLVTALRDHDDHASRFVGMVRQRFSDMILDSVSLCSLTSASDSCWVAKGKAGNTEYVVTANPAQECVMRTAITRLYQAWAATYVQLDELAFGEVLHKYRQGWRRWFL
jgi:hypothetical protein